MRLLVSTTLLFAACALAVDIGLFPAGHCKGKAGLCKNIKIDSCCHGIKFHSAAVKGIKPQQIFGTFVPNKRSHTCGKATAAKKGNGCVQGKGGEQTGAAFVNPKGSDVDVDTLGSAQCKEFVLADTVLVDGRSFSINYHVPRDDTAALIDLIERDAAIEDFPEHLIKWEVVE